MRSEATRGMRKVTLTVWAAVLGAAIVLSRVDQLAKDRATAVFEASRLTSGELEDVLLRCRAAGLDLLGLNELPLP